MVTTFQLCKAAIIIVVFAAVAEFAIITYQQSVINHKLYEFIDQYDPNKLTT